MAKNTGGACPYGKSYTRYTGGRCDGLCNNCPANITKTGEILSTKSKANIFRADFETLILAKQENYYE